MPVVKRKQCLYERVSTHNIVVDVEFEPGKGRCLGHHHVTVFEDNSCQSSFGIVAYGEVDEHRRKKITDTIVAMLVACMPEDVKQ